MEIEQRRDQRRRSGRRRRRRRGSGVRTGDVELHLGEALDVAVLHLTRGMRKI